MSPTLVLVAVVAVLVAAGIFLLLERSLTRIVLGVLLLGNGVNLLILSSGGAAGEPPILGVSSPSRMADPLPQAMVLTAIVITLALTAFLLAMVHRSWQLLGHDEVQDDVEDRRIVLSAGRADVRHRIRAERRAHRRWAREQRRALRAKIAATHRRELAGRRELEERIAKARADLQGWIETHAEDDEVDREDVARKVRAAKATAQVGRAALAERVDSAEQELRRLVSEFRREEREARAELRRRTREARQQVRARIRAERERQARALGPEGDT